MLCLEAPVPLPTLRSSKVWRFETLQNGVILHLRPLDFYHAAVPVANPSFLAQLQFCQTEAQCPWFRAGADQGAASFLNAAPGPRGT